MSNKIILSQNRKRSKKLKMVSVLMAYKKLNRKRSEFKIQKMIHIQKKYLANLVKDKTTIGLTQVCSKYERSIKNNPRNLMIYSSQT